MRGRDDESDGLTKRLCTDRVPAAFLPRQARPGVGLSRFLLETGAAVAEAGGPAASSPRPRRTWRTMRHGPAPSYLSATEQDRGSAPPRGERPLARDCAGSSSAVVVWLEALLKSGVPGIE